MIAVIVLTHNNETSIKKTLESLLWCDERIVIDDFSSDKTVFIAKSYQTKIYQRHLQDDFAAQRNFGLQKAKGDWVLFIDSDEVVSTKLQKEIIEATKSQDTSGYYLKRHDYLFGKALLHGETGRVRLLRLAQKSAGIWKRPIHEVWDVKGSTGELQNPLYHFPHPDVAQFLTDINTYSTLNAKYLFDTHVRTSFVEIILYPKAKFFLNYIWFAGFLDGTSGTVLALMMSFHSFLTRAKLYQLQQRDNHSHTPIDTCC
jgi:glycosyltransferase involved in cell wall biosynthesis